MPHRRIVPFSFYLPLTGLSFTSLLWLSVWLNHFSLLFGTHAVSFTTLHFSVFICMGMGCLLAGRLADRMQHRFSLPASLYIFLCLFGFASPWLFKLIELAYSGLCASINPGSLSTGGLRFLLSFLFFMIPVGIVSAIATLLTRYFIRSTQQTGKFLSALVLSTGAGGAAGLLMILLAMPAIGYKTIHIISNILFLTLSVISCLPLMGSKFRIAWLHAPALTYKVRKTALRFQKRKAVPATGPKLVRALVRVFGFQAMCLTMSLVICTRILSGMAPASQAFAHNFPFVVIMAGVALGSAFFRRIAEKHANQYLSMATYQIVTGFLSVLVYVLAMIIVRITGDHLGTSAVRLSLSAHAMLSILMIAPPAFTMGMTLPLAGGVYVKRMQVAGENLGKLGFIWLLNALTGMAIARYILIPVAGQYFAYFILVLLIIVSGIYLIINDSRLVRGFRLGYAIVTILLFSLWVVTFNSYTIRLFGHKFRLQSDRPYKKNEGSTVSVSTQDTTWQAKVLMNNQFYFNTDRESGKIQALPAYIPIGLNNSIRSALVYEFGAGLAPMILDNQQVQQIQIVESFPEMIRFSPDVFADLNDDVITSSYIDITNEDVRCFLHRTNKFLDLIIPGVATYQSVSDIYSIEFYRLCYKKTTSEAMVCQILPLFGVNILEFKSMIKAAAEVFPSVSLWYLSPGEVLLVASKNQFTDLCDLSGRFSRLNSKHVLGELGIDNEETLMAHLMVENQSLRLWVDDAEACHDDKPFMLYRLAQSIQYDSAISAFLKSTHPDRMYFFNKLLLCPAWNHEKISRAKQINAELRRQLFAVQFP
jgi:spermidine synthase